MEGGWTGYARPTTLQFPPNYVKTTIIAAFCAPGEGYDSIRHNRFPRHGSKTIQAPHLGLDNVRLGQLGLCHHHPGCRAAGLLQPGGRRHPAQLHHRHRLLERRAKHLPADRCFPFTHSWHHHRHHARQKAVPGGFCRNWHPRHRAAGAGGYRRLGAGFHPGHLRTDRLQRGQLLLRRACFLTWPAKKTGMPSRRAGMPWATWAAGCSSPSILS